MHIFVYGTLRPKDSTRGSVLGQLGGKHVGPATVGGQLFDLGAFPAAIFSENDHVTPIRGDLFEVPSDKLDKALSVLDRIEGHPHFYTRTTVDAITREGTVEAIAYQGASALRLSKKLIVSGDWFSRG